MIFPLTTCMLGLLFVLVKGEWLRFSGQRMWGVDLLSVLIAYLYLNWGRTGANLFAFGSGFLVDTLSGGLRGLFTLLYLSVFWAVHGACRFFHLSGPKGQVVVIGLAVLSKNALFLLFLVWLYNGTRISPSVLWPLAGSAIISGLVAPLIFHLLDQARALSAKGSRKKTKASLWGF